MAKKKTRRSRRQPAKSSTSPVVSMLFGLAVGLSVAVAVYVKGQEPGPTTAGAANPSAAVAEPVSAPASLQTTLDNNGETAEKEEKRFTFYDILPNFEVVTRDDEPTTEPDVAPEAIVEPGVYVLQAGSFSTDADADRRRAELALHGIESHIQRVKVNDRNYHRVYVGPTDDLDELNMLRSRLRAAQIDVFRIRLSDD